MFHRQPPELAIHVMSTVNHVTLMGK